MKVSDLSGRIEAWYNADTKQVGFTGHLHGLMNDNTKVISIVMQSNSAGPYSSPLSSST